MSTPSTLADLLPLLESGATLLLPNGRAAHALRGAFNARQQTLGRAAWQPAAALSWQQWAAGLWSDLIVSGADPRLLLNPAQEHALWQEIVAADPAIDALGSPTRLAALARSAFHLAASSKATDRLRSAAATPDSRIFAAWAATFTRLCAARGYLSPSLLDTALREHLEAQTLPAPPTLHLAGFPDFTPAQQSLLTVLRENGTELHHHRLLSIHLADPRAVQASQVPQGFSLGSASSAESGVQASQVPQGFSLGSHSSAESGVQGSQVPQGFSLGSASSAESGAQATQVPQGFSLGSHSSAESGALAPGVCFLPERLKIAAIAPTEREELLLAARWVRAFLEHHPNPAQASVAVLVPNLTEDRAELESVFREVLAPELQSISADLSSAPWEIAAGVPLASLPLVAIALDLARWVAAPLPLEHVSSLLLSRFLGDPIPSSAPSTATPNSTPIPPQFHPPAPQEITPQSEATAQSESLAQREALAQFDTRILRRAPLLRPEIALNTLLALLESPQARALSSTHQPPLLWPRNLHTLLARTGDLTRPRAFAEWAEFLRDVLRTANWPNPANAANPPGPNPLTANETAASEAFDDLLDLIATLDFSGRRVPFSTALEALEHHAQTTLFRPPPTHAPVQVMSITSSAGSIFDATVFLRATAANWPPPERADPLLPWPLQRSLRLPGTDPTAATARAHAFTADLLARSSSVLFTSAAANADGPILPSPLLSEFDIPSLDPASLVSAPPLTPPIVLETVLDDAPLPAPPSVEVQGGASVLQLQAACGFRAFAELRLRATAPESAEIGLDRRESGTLIHRVLQLFWDRVDDHSQAALRAMTSQQRTDLLSRCLDDVLPTSRSASPWEIAYLAVQKDRQLGLLQTWLTHELQRGPFTVLSLEGQQHVSVGPLTFAVRVDRIDQVPGGVCFVDYKTGAAASPVQWDDPRPDEPQLPLYALLPEPAELQAVAFARIRAGRDMGWAGLQTAPGILPTSTSRNTTDLEQKQSAWRANLTQLAEAFHAGDVSVDPKNYPQTCTHCTQRLLCRLDPASLSDLLGDNDAHPSDAGPAVEDIRG